MVMLCVRLKSNNPNSSLLYLCIYILIFRYKHDNFTVMFSFRSQKPLIYSYCYSVARRAGHDR